MARGSALDYVYNTLHLLEGRSYTRTMNVAATREILRWISDDYGRDIALRAAEAVLRHVEYYARLPRGGRQKGVETVVQEFRALEAAGPAVSFSSEVEIAFAATSEERAKKLALGNPIPATAIVKTIVFLRNPHVVAEALHRLDGHCGGCGNPAPFKRSDGSGYLEVHHRIPLSEGGPDTVENAVALCPNCHREAHHGANKERFRQ
jgi:5-methylcytosine-specific restriction protein A